MQLVELDLKCTKASQLHVAKGFLFSSAPNNAIHKDKLRSESKWTALAYAAAKRKVFKITFPGAHTSKQGGTEQF